MKTAKSLLLTALLSTIFVAGPARSQAFSSVQVSSEAAIVSPGGLTVVNDLLVQSGISVKVSGSGDTVSLAVPGAVRLVSGTEQGLLPLRVMRATAMINGATMTTEDIVNVQVGGAVQGKKAGRYEGIMLVLAQYN